MNYTLIVLSYLIGAIPFGLVIGKCLGKDIRKEGSGNIGATNASRLLGKKWGLLTLIADTAKALVPMIIAAYLLKESTAKETIVALCGAAAFLGHLFPVYLKFSGGKGVATALGIFLYLEPLAVLVDLIVFIAVVATSKYVSVGSLIAAAAIPLLVWTFNGPKAHVLLALFVAVLVWVKHHENIKRLRSGEEKPWSSKKS